VFVLGEIIAFVRVEVNVRTVHLGGCRRREVRTTLDTNLDSVVLETDQGERLGPIFAKEEWDDEIIGTASGVGRVRLGVTGDLTRSRGTRGFRGGFVVEDIVNTLNIKCVELAHFLTAYMERELGRVSLTGREQTVSVRENVGDVFRFDPHITEKITLGTDGNDDFVRATERTDEVHTLGLDRKVRMTLVVLAEERYLGVASDIHILSTLRYKINQRS